METGNGSARNDDEDEGQYRPANDGTATSGKFGDGWHFQCGVYEYNAHGQHQNGADFQVGRQVIARYQQQPNRQYGRQQAVDGNGDGNRFNVPMKEITDGFVLYDAMATNDID